MKFRVNNRALAKAIQPAVVVATDNCVKEFAYEGLITIKAEKKNLVLLSYGGTASSISVISDSNAGSDLKYKCAKEGTVTVKALDFNDSLTTFESGEVEVAMISGELVTTLLSDKSNKRSMPILDTTVTLPKAGVEFEQSVDMKRSIFEIGLNDISFAPADEEKMQTYMCMLMETSVKKGIQKATFHAGTGGRFAVKSIESTPNGDDILKAQEDVSIIFPKNNLPTIHKVIKGLRGDWLKIRCVEHNQSKNIPGHIMLECDGITLCLFGSEGFTKFPKLDKIIENVYPNRINSDPKGWEFVAGGIGMTRRGHDSNIHNTEVIFESENERFMVTPQTAHACTTPVHIVDVDECVAKGEKIWFKCNSKYLEEAVARSKRHGNMQFNFESQQILEDIPKDKPKHMKPILIKYPEKSNDAKEIIENFCMFFTVSTK